MIRIEDCVLLTCFCRALLVRFDFGFRLEQKDPTIIAAHRICDEVAQELASDLPEEEQNMMSGMCERMRWYIPNVADAGSAGEGTTGRDEEDTSSPVRNGRYTVQVHIRYGR